MRGNAVDRSIGPAVRQLEEPALGSRESVGGPRVFLEETRESRSEIRQRRRVPLAQVRPEPRASAPETPARRAPPTILRLADTLPRFEQRRQFVWRELAEALESRMTGKRSDAHEAHRLRGRKVLANPGQELNEIQLIEEVVLEPQNQLVVRLVTFDRGAPLPSGR